MVSQADPRQLTNHSKTLQVNVSSPNRSKAQSLPDSTEG